MLHQFAIILQIRKIDVIYIGYNLDYTHPALNVLLDLVIVLTDVLRDFCCF